MSIDDQFDRAAELFDRARVLGPAKRKAFLRLECDGDKDLESEVRELLGHHDQSGDFLQNPVAAGTTFAQFHQDTLQDAGQALHPERIGGYTICSVLGSGGMGIVYLADQENPQRKVAVKVIRPALTDNQTRQRFELEAALLGRLQHRGIAQIYEAGLHEDAMGSRPFFAMEFVNGPPLNRYLQQANATIDAKLDLFERICATVQYAHQKGVVHRDLKPANILVTTDQNFPLPKILDFGVAKATDTDFKLTSPHTHAGQLLGTLPYMSPEQVLGHTRNIDVRSDIYALGVILYEMISGQLPIDLQNRSLAEAARRIVDERPRPLGEVARIPGGDLNTIVMKALNPEPDRRYQSASDLAADVHRFRNDQPIDARPPSTLYQLRKFARRHRGLVTGMLVALLALVAGAVASSIFAIDKTRALKQSEKHLVTARQKQELAEKNFAEARAAIDRLTELSKQLSTIPETDEIRQRALREVLNFYLSHIEESDDPDVALGAANTHRGIARIRAELNDYVGAIDDLARDRKILEQLSDEYPESSKYRDCLAQNYFEAGAFLEALGRNEEAVRSHLISAGFFQMCWQDSGNSNYHLGRACALNNAAGCYMILGQIGRATELNDEATNLFETHGTGSFYSRFNAGIGYELRGELLAQKGNWMEAVRDFRTALEHMEEATRDGYKHPDNIDYIARIRSDLANALLRTGANSAEWRNHAACARDLYQLRWESRPDRPALGVNYANHCWNYGVSSWFDEQADSDDEMHSGEELFHAAIETYRDIDDRFPEFSNDGPERNEIGYRLCLLLALCPVEDLRDTPAALARSRQMLRRHPSSCWPRVANAVCESLIGDIEAAEEILDRESWFDDRAPSIKRLLKLLVDYRGARSISDSEIEFAHQVRKDMGNPGGFGQPLADRILKMFETDPQNR